MWGPTDMPKLADDETALGVHSVHHFRPRLHLVLRVDSWGMAQSAQAMKKNKKLQPTIKLYYNS
jgi:hypothetical protein